MDCLQQPQHTLGLDVDGGRVDVGSGEDLALSRDGAGGREGQDGERSTHVDGLQYSFQGIGGGEDVGICCVDVVWFGGKKEEEDEEGRAETGEAGNDVTLSR